jgi:hypothetical protein
MFLASQVFKEHWDEVKKNMSHYQQLFSLWSALQLTFFPYHWKRNTSSTKVTALQAVNEY